MKSLRTFLRRLIRANEATAVVVLTVVITVVLIIIGGIVLFWPALFNEIGVLISKGKDGRVKVRDIIGLTVCIASYLITSIYFEVKNNTNLRYRMVIIGVLCAGFNFIFNLFLVGFNISRMGDFGTIVMFFVVFGLGAIPTVLIVHFFGNIIRKFKTPK